MLSVTSKESPVVTPLDRPCVARRNLLQRAGAGLAYSAVALSVGESDVIGAASVRDGKIDDRKQSAPRVKNANVYPENFAKGRQ